jgi:glycosyltransferase involved in cell wall biosynthesis
VIDILQVTPTLFGADGAWGGGERYPVELARAQSEMARTRLVSVGAQANRWHDGGLDVTVLPVRHRWKGYELNVLSERLVGLIARSRVVHVHQYNTALTSLCLLVGAALRKPVFVTDHGGSAPSLNARLRLHRLVRRYLSVSEYAINFFPQLADRSAVIHGGVDTRRFQPPPCDGRRARQVVYVGRMLPHKGLDILIEALDGELPLHLYGAHYDAAYRARLGELAAGKNVVFHHGASDAEVVHAIQRSRVAVLPSVYRTYDGGEAPNAEYFGLVLAEAMACGTPVVGTRVGGIPEVVADGVTGRVVEPSDVQALRAAILDIIDAPDQRWSEWSDACVERVARNFTWRTVAERCMRFYASS